ncbi:uncharacterized protein LOC100372579 [Saccoglossus kowalevskii]|uniref:Trichohyalin-like n=1 Tax=Saccoglossus kowalevskii TaxID=10224 RepID=A0ABM0MD12_SACKO|nr:PREDICTED: trichohyalin-like [Saccoglossus kowalevskii]
MSSCTDVLVLVPATYTSVNVTVVVVCAIFGFLLGIIIAILLARCILRDLARSRVQEEEKAMLLENMAYERRSSTGSFVKRPLSDHGVMTSDDESPRRQRRSRPNSAYSSDGEGYSMERYDEDDYDQRGVGVISALTKQTSDKTELELNLQDINALKELEHEMHDQKIMTFLQVLSIILNRCVARGKIDADQGSELMEKYEKELETEEKKIQMEEKMAIDELRQDPKLNKDPLALEEAMEKLRPNYIRRMDSVTKRIQMNIAEDLAQNTELTSDEIEAIMQKLTENMSALDRHLGEESARQAMILQERLAKRQAMAEKWKQSGEQERDSNQMRVEDHHRGMDKLIEDRLLVEAQRDNIMKQYTADTARLQGNHEAEVLRQSRHLAEKLTQHREKRMKRLELKQQEQKETLINKASKVVDPKDFVEAYHGLMQQQREERNQFIEELDHKESEELENMRKQLQAQRSEEMEKQEESFCEILAQRARLSEKETDKIMRKHEANMKAHDEKMIKEKKRQRSKLQEQIAEKKQKWEEDIKRLQSENKVLIEQQEAAVQKVLKTQGGLDEDARRVIMLNHEQNVQTLTNQLQMTKIRQQKILEAKLNQRKAYVEALRKKQEEELNAKADASEEEIRKLEKKQEKELEAELQALEEEKNKALIQLRRQLTQETEEALKAQDEEMSLLIGKLTMGQARRKGIIAKQDKAIKELQEQLTETVAKEDDDATARKTEKILDRHLQQVEDLQDKMQSERENQMRMLKEKYEAKKLKRERDVKDSIAVDVQATPELKKKKGASAAAVMNKLLMEQRHKQALSELEKDLKLEMTKQKEELDMILETQMKEELEVTTYE